MSISPVTSITRAATRKDEPLNILTFPTHERYETNLCKTGHNFYSYCASNVQEIKSDWNRNYGEPPENYMLLDGRLDMLQIPLDVDFDLVLCQNKFGQFQLGQNIARQLQLPVVCLEHTLPMPMWPPERLEAMRNMVGDINVFISDFSVVEWGFSPFDSVVIKHCVDSDYFFPDDELGNIERENRILSVVNDWINRDWCCGFQIWQRVTQGLPVFPVGDTKGLSKPAKPDELVGLYSGSRIFVNTSTISPVPTALLEAMSCGCAVVSTATCMIPEIIENGVNGFITNNEDEMRAYLEQLLNDKELATKLGKAARQTIIDKFSVERFTMEWNDIFNRVANIGIVRSIQ